MALAASFPAVGACHLDEMRSVAVFVGLAALILGLVVASLWLTGFPRLAPVWAVASIGLAVVGFGNLADPATTGWAWWFIGMQDTLLVVLGIRSGARGQARTRPAARPPGRLAVPLLIPSPLSGSPSPSSTGRGMPGPSPFWCGRFQ